MRRRSERMSAELTFVSVQRTFSNVRSSSSSFASFEETKERLPIILVHDPPHAARRSVGANVWRRRTTGKNKAGSLLTGAALCSARPEPPSRWQTTGDFETTVVLLCMKQKGNTCPRVGEAMFPGRVKSSHGWRARMKRWLLTQWRLALCRWNRRGRKKALGQMPAGPLQTTAGGAPAQGVFRETPSGLSASW